MTERKNPIVTFKIGGQLSGEFKAELLPEVAPNTVNNFISLINKGFYNGVIFHRVIPGFVIQGGDPTGSGMGGPGYDIKGEFLANGFAANTLHHGEGVLSMARAMDPDSGGSQFFVCDADVPHLDSQYAGFGRVTEGMELVHQIARVAVNAMDKPLDPVRMEEVTVETFGLDYPEPEKR